MYINDLAMRGMILRNLMIFLLLCFLFLFSATAGLGAEKLFVKSPKAPLWVEPSFQAEQILVLTKGQDVEKMEQRAGWLRVRIADQQGWMLKMMLSEEPPIQFSKEQQQAMENLALALSRCPLLHPLMTCYLKLKMLERLSRIWMPLVTTNKFCS